MTTDPRERVVVRPATDDAATSRTIASRAVRRGFRRLALPAESAVPEGALRFEVQRDSILAPNGVRAERHAVDSLDQLGEMLARPVPAVAVRWVGERVIPLENAIAARRPGTQLWVEGVVASRAPALLGALERGADLVIVDISTPEELDELEATLDARPSAPIPWTTGRVTSVRPAGMGDRVLVDTTSLLAPSEGLAVGSTSEVLFHVVSEAEGSRYTRPRRFRVNAGAPHAYVRMADGTTRYLSELEPGEELLAVDRSGAVRGVRVGRLKIERRPLTLVEVEADRAIGRVFLQEAETVRLAGPGGNVAVTALEPGAVVAVTLGAPARHLGRSVDESIEER